MRYTKLIIFAILTLNFVFSAAAKADENKFYTHKNGAIERLQEKLKNIKGTDEIPREAILKSLKHNPALRSLIEDPAEPSEPHTVATKILRSENLKRLSRKVRSVPGDIDNGKGDTQYIIGNEFHDEHCREHVLRLVKYVGCTMAEFGTWESVKFSGPKNSNVTFYVYDRPNCNGQGHGVRSFIKDTCMYDRETKKYAIWTW